MAFYYFPPQYGSLAGDFKVVYKPTMKLKEEAAEEEKDGGWRAEQTEVSWNLSTD